MGKIYTLKSGKIITEDEMAEILEIIHREDDLEDIRSRLDSGIFDDDTLFDDIPESYIAEIASEKAYHERQEGLSWDEAADLAIYKWAEKQYNRLLDTLWASYCTLPGREGTTREEFENSQGMFHCRGAMQKLASKEDMEVWDTVVAAEGEDDLDD